MDETNIKKRLSIIVPVYNVEKYIERCLLSLLNQDIPKSEYEIIVVNDGTPDNSADIAQSIADKNENIIVIHRENGGLSAARNTGMEYVHGEYVMFVDSDDYIEPNVLASIFKSANSGNVDMLAFSTCRRRKDNQINWVHTFNDYLDGTSVTDGITLLRKGFEPTSVWTYLYKTEFLNSYSFRFKEGIIHEDIEFNYRVFTKASRIGAIDLLVYDYCLNDELSITKGRTLKQEVYAMMSNMEVAASIKSYIRHETIPDDIFKKYDTIMNSMLAGQIVSFFRDGGKLRPMQFAVQYIQKSKELYVYPIKGFKSSFKAKIACMLINFEPLLMLMLRISRK